MPKFNPDTTTISLEAWDPRCFDPKTENAKSFKLLTDPPEATPYATPKDPDGERPATLKEGYYKDEDYDCVHFLDSLPFYLVRSGAGYFTPEYHITRPRLEDQRDEILARWKGEDGPSGQAAPLPSIASQLVEPSPSKRSKKLPKPSALQQRVIDATPRPIALRIAVKLMKKSFSPTLHRRELLPRTFKGTEPADLCVNIFYNGEFVHSRPIHSRFSPKYADQYCVRAFSGRSVGNRIEAPFIMLPQAQGASDVSESNAQRWGKIGESLLAESHNWENSDATKRDAKKSIMTQYLENISNLKMPDDMKETQHVGMRKFGIIDVIVTAGIAHIPDHNTVATIVLKEPRRLLATGPIGKYGDIYTLNLDAKLKRNQKKISIAEQNPPGGSDPLPVKDSYRAILPSPETTQQSDGSGMEPPPPKRRKHQREERSEVEDAELRGSASINGTAHRGDVLGDSSDNVAALTPPATQEANKEDASPRMRKRKRVATTSATGDTNQSDNGSSSAKAKRVQLPPNEPEVATRLHKKAPSRKNNNRSKERGYEGAQNANARGQGTVGSSEAAVPSEDDWNLYTASPPSSLAPKATTAGNDKSKGKAKQTNSKASSNNRKPANETASGRHSSREHSWDPSALNADSVLTFGTEIYNDENYSRRDRAIAFREGSLQERENLFATTGVLMAVRFVVDP